MTDVMLHDLLADMKRWKEGLPDHLKFNGPQTSKTAGKRLGISYLSSISNSSIRSTSSTLRLRMHDVLARLHEDQLLLSRALEV